MALLRGDPAGTYRHAIEGLAIFYESADHAGAAAALECLAGAAGADDPVRALRLAGAAAAIRETVELPRQRVEPVSLDRWLELARQALTAETQAAALEAGRAMTVEQAIAYALEEPEWSLSAGSAESS
jgi:hypothetical protein